MFVKMLRFLQFFTSDQDGSLDYIRISLPTLALAWLSWRIWTFTLKPTFQPREPRELPYWVPSKRYSSYSSVLKLIRNA